MLRFVLYNKPYEDILKNTRARAYRDRINIWDFDHRVGFMHVVKTTWLNKTQQNGEKGFEGNTYFAVGWGGYTISLFVFHTSFSYDALHLYLHVSSMRFNFFQIKCKPTYRVFPSANSKSYKAYSQASGLCIVAHSTPICAFIRPLFFIYVIIMKCFFYIF